MSSNAGGTLAGTGLATLNVSNSTFASNQSSLPGGAIASANFNNDSSYGSASANLTITNSTIVGNTTPNQSGAIYSGKLSATGSGSAQATLRNTILASNTGVNCYSQNSTFTAGLNNLEYTGSTGSATCGGGSNVTTVNPVVGTIPTDNGGPTRTILPTGPAIDGGDNATCAATLVNNFDQRGTTRPAGAACDVGAVEAGGNFIVRNNTDSGDSLTVGSLSYYLKYATGGQTIIFALTNGQTLKVSGLLPPLLPQAHLESECNKVVVDGTGVNGDGLQLAGNNVVKGVTVKGFGGRQIVTIGTGNRLSCTVASVR